MDEMASTTAPVAKLRARKLKIRPTTTSGMLLLNIAVSAGFWRLGAIEVKSGSDISGSDR